MSHIVCVCARICVHVCVSSFVNNQQNFISDQIHGEKLVNLAIHQNFPRQYSDTLKMYVAYALTSLFAKFFLANSFYLCGSPKFSRVWY